MKKLLLISLLFPFISNSQNLLFSSGFEDTVELSSPIANGGQWYQYFSGTDLSTGFQWPNDLPTVTQLDAYWTFKVPDSVSLTDYAEIKLDTVDVHSGNRSLYMEVSDYNNGNFGNSMAGWVRCEYRLNLDTTMNQAYISYWMKVQPDIYDIMQFGTNRWRMIMEWFETGSPSSDYRWGLSPRVSSFASDSTSAYWLFYQDYQVGSGSGASFIGDTSYFNQQILPLNDWFKVEVYWKQAPDMNGHILAAINGDIIFDEYGRNMNDTFPSVLSNWQIFKLYVDEPSMDQGLVYQWIDDVEIWDTIPNGAFSSMYENNVHSTKTEVLLYPNPSAGNFRVQTSWEFDPNQDELSVISIDGKNIAAQMNISSKFIDVYLQNPEHGIYFLRIRHLDQVFFQRFVIE